MVQLPIPRCDLVRQLERIMIRAWILIVDIESARVCDIRRHLDTVMPAACWVHVELRACPGRDEARVPSKPRWNLSRGGCMRS